MEETKKLIESRISDIKGKKQRVTEELAGFTKNIKMLTMKLDEGAKTEAKAVE